MARRPKPALIEAELADRRRAVDSALGSLRIEGMELEPEGREIMERFARGEIDLATMHAEVDAYCKTIVCTPA
jgi:Antitoxin VbhA